MTPPARKKWHLTAEEVCTIVEKGRQCGVQYLELEGLKISWGMRPGQVQPAHAPFSQARVKEVELQAIGEEELRLKEDELEQMRIENPMEYERLIALGELMEPTGFKQAGDGRRKEETNDF